MSQKNKSLHGLKINKVMTKKPVKVNKDTLVAKALSLMNEKKITSLCVFSSNKKNKTIGIIHIHNILENNIS